ncbi:MAG: hypothetical protein E7335_04475 [Clostridiales bacterium]|nr:hypothetical protein [Clostridiales bacterium]
MDKQQKKFQAPMVGGSSLLVIFAILCLTVFALLGFSTVQADRRLADASIKAVEGYYKADSEAERILAAIRSGEAPAGVQCDENVYRYACTVSDTQKLLVEARVENRDEWEILRWQTVSTAEWNEEEYITVWDGES